MAGRLSTNFNLRRIAYALPVTGWCLGAPVIQEHCTITATRAVCNTTTSVYVATGGLV